MILSEVTFEDGAESNVATGTSAVANPSSPQVPEGLPPLELCLL